MSQRRSKLQRKRDRIVQSTEERLFHASMGRLRTVRDEQLRDANKAFDAAVAEAATERDETRKKVRDEYEDARAKLIERGAAAEEKAA